MQVTLPWPPKALSANSRKDRRHTTAVRQGYKAACYDAGQGAVIAPDALLSITFHPPDLRKRDLDNMLASIKYGLDGLALAAGVDDYGWSLAIERGDKVKGGAVVVEIRGQSVD